MIYDLAIGSEMLLDLIWPWNGLYPLNFHQFAAVLRSQTPIAVAFEINFGLIEVRKNKAFQLLILKQAHAYTTV